MLPGVIVPAAWATAIFLALRSASPTYLEYYADSMWWLWVLCWAAGVLSWGLSGRVIPRWVPGLVAGAITVRNAAGYDDTVVTDRFIETYGFAVGVVVATFVVLSAFMVMADVAADRCWRFWKAGSRFGPAAAQSD